MVDFEIKPYPGEDEIAFTKRKAYYHRLIVPRLEYCRAVIKNKLGCAIPLTKAEREEIDAFWAPYMTPEVRDRLVDYRYYEVFKSTIKEGERLCDYIPDSFFYLFIDEYFTNPQHSSPFDDKNLYDLLFYDIDRPTTVFRKVKDLLLDRDYNMLTFDQVMAKVKEYGEVILKVAKFSSGGHGIFFWNAEKNSENELKQFLQNNTFVVCQEIIKQHAILDELNPTSLNTLRLMTFIFKGKLYMPSNAIRFGLYGQKTDNINSGGLACGLEPDGRFKDIAYDINIRPYNVHPGNGKPFSEYKIPNFDKCVDIVTSLAKKFYMFSQLISWDIAIDKNGNPKIIEFNVSSGINFHQVCNGPLFGELTQDVLDEVFHKSYTLNSIIKSMQK